MTPDARTIIEFGVFTAGRTSTVTDVADSIVQALRNAGLLLPDLPAPDADGCWPDVRDGGVTFSVHVGREYQMTSTGDIRALVCLETTKTIPDPTITRPEHDVHALDLGNAEALGLALIAASRAARAQENTND